ncbi:MAG: GDP-perosamine synthase [Actinobacteria bacterium]|nr:GDP-perosamine synthase [Actinomycetota bacterium]
MAIITTKDRFKEIKKEAPNVLFIENPKKIIKKIKSFCKEENVVLLEGRIPKEIVESLDSLMLMNFLKPISISLSPNTEKDDILLALKLLFQPWRWQKENLINYPDGEKFKFLSQLEEKFKNYFGLKYAISFNSGRSALMAILNSLGLEKDDEVLIQAFTCNAAVNPILWSGLKPIYIDCDEKTFNIDIEDLKRKITKKSRVVMVQHTFGLPADLNEILEICQKNNLILIEDCAHSLGAEYKSKKWAAPTEALAKVGTFGKAGFFSFSRDKVISSVYGGMAITNDDELGKKIREYQKKIGFPSDCWIFQQLLHPVLINWLVLPFYEIFGKYLLILFQWLQVLSKAVHWKEKRGLKPGYFPKRLPNALAILVLNQFKKLERFNNHRKKIAEIYRQELKNTSFELPQEEEQIYLRFTVKHPKAHEIIKKAWQKNLLIGDWYDIVIAPRDTKLEKMHYLPGSCPKAEKLAKITLNLPTHINISKKEAQKIIDFLKNSSN